MAKISVEKSAYIQSQQQYLADLKVGQFAKFLNKNPIYVTYYPVINALSRVDSGTGAIQEEIGPNSPVRYNKIKELPAFNFPEMKPDVINDEGGYDIELDLTDIAFIGGTIRPRPGDYMKVTLANSKPLLFRCRMYRHNTIQSNDYYEADFDLQDIDQEYIQWIEKQVETTYTCHFENIGTNQKVMISEDEEAGINDVADLVDTLTDFYVQSFYNSEVDGFVLYEGNQFGTQWYCDNYLTRFLNESEIFVDESSDVTRVFPYLELLPINFDYLYARTVWNAVLKRSNFYIYQYMYAWSRIIQKRTSPLMLASIPTLHPTLKMFDKYVKPEEETPKELTDMIWTPGQGCGWNGYDPMLRPYFSMNLLKSLASGAKPEELNLVENMIYQYVCIGPSAVTYSKDELLKFAFNQDLFTYMHLPIVIYILKQYQSTIASNDTTE